MLGLYRDVAVLAFKRAARSWLAALSIPVYAIVFVGAALLLTRLGMIGGFLLAFVGAACLAGYLYLLSDAVTGTKIRLRDLKTGMRGIWDVISVLFALMVVGLGVRVLVGAAGSKGAAVAGVAELAGAFFFNALPELLYNSRNRSFQLLKESVQFVMANPFSWFIPNIVFALILLGVAGGPLWVSNPAELLVKLAGMASPFALAQAVMGAPLWAAPLLVAFFHYVMVFRGLLYRELATGSPRMRAFRRAAG